MNWNSIDRVFAKDDNGDDLSSGKQPPAPNPEPGTGPDDGDSLG